jgi:hypothetical protein
LSKINVTDYLYPGCAETNKLTVEDEEVVVPIIVAPSRGNVTIRSASHHHRIDNLRVPRVISRIEKPVAGLPSKLDKVMGTLPGKIPESPPQIVFLNSMFLDGLLPKAQISPVNHSGERVKYQIFSHVVMSHLFLSKKKTNIKF